MKDDESITPGACGKIAESHHLWKSWENPRQILGNCCLFQWGFRLGNSMEIHLVNSQSDPQQTQFIINFRQLIFQPKKTWQGRSVNLPETIIEKVWKSVLQHGRHNGFFMGFLGQPWSTIHHFEVYDPTRWAFAKFSTRSCFAARYLWWAFEGKDGTLEAIACFVKAQENSVCFLKYDNH